MLTVSRHALHNGQSKLRPAGGLNEPISPSDQAEVLQGSISLPATREGLKGRQVLSELGPDSFVQRSIDDWFKFIHPLVPLLHRRRFLSRFHSGEADHKPEFLALVISVIAVTSSCLDAGNVPGKGMTMAVRCDGLIEEHGLLSPNACSVDWCVAQYTLAFALIGQLGLPDWRVFRAVKNSIAGVQWFLYYNKDEKTLHDKEVAKRLYWLLAAWDLYVLQFQK